VPDEHVENADTPKGAHIARTGPPSLDPLENTIGQNQKQTISK